MTLREALGWHHRRVNGRWDVTLRLAGPIARRPMRIALGALLISALGVVGLARFGVDSGLALEGRGPSLLVGSQSSTAQTYRAFSQTFGAGAIVVSFGADNASAPYLEPNLRRLSALELDLAHDPRVASVLGPGTVAASLTEAAVADVNRALTEYPYFIAETDSLGQIAGGSGSSTQLAQRFQAVYTSAQQALELALVAAVRDAILARVNYQSTAGARILDSQEKAVDAALAKETLPPLWAQYVAGPGQTPNNTQAQSVFTRYAAAYGVCDPAIAGLLKIPTDCQPFFERSLLDLPACPTIGSKGVFCSPKAQWASVLPAPQPGGPTYLVISVRLKPQYATDATQVEAVRTKILDNLRKGVNDEKFAYPRELRGKASFLDALSSQSRATLKALGALQPTECAGESSSQNSACR